METSKRTKTSIMITPKIKRNVNRIIPFAIIFTIFMMIYSLLEKGILGNSKIYPSTGNPYNFNDNFLHAVFISFILGLLIGTLEIVYLNKLFSKKSFSKKIIYKTITYVFIIIFCTIIVTLSSNSKNLNSNLFNKQVWYNVWAFVSNFAFWSIEIYIAAMVIISLFYVEVSDNLGQSVFENFLTGKYHNPIVEERFFMFLDMKSSTAIAEKLGHVKYFEFLREYYNDISDPIVQFSGEIYQYVGDELVVSWKMNDGKQNNNCFKCFYEMKNVLISKSSKYQEKYGVLPTFKAGFHFGEVTTGEIGAIKKEIIFTGDVLNTTARIQGLCNKYEVEILFSGQMLKQIDLGSEYNSREIGEKELRGKNKKVELFTLIPNIQS